MLLEAMKISSGGTATSILRELETSGFISAYIPFGKKSGDVLYRISDEFILFHLHWIAPLGKQRNARYLSWSGYSFEYRPKKE